MAEKQSTSSPESIRQDHFISSYIIMVRLLSSFGDWSVFCFRSKRSAWLKLELGCGGEGESVGLRERMVPAVVSRERPLKLHRDTEQADGNSEN